ncbi:hypothetical protein HHL28_04475 [Aerophototrophica crusticola]|uniref:Uncharacterized protein n=1 Tax=Aerophototrophica crusticola TaxID=1709002 RepID=A0A858R4Y7_9PROT|nr:hypothetical protein HHL28_04475 [Rhodospirillaceae bacterium B3]
MSDFTYFMKLPEPGSRVKSLLLPWGPEGPPPADQLPAQRPKDYHPLAAWPPIPYTDWAKRRHAASFHRPNDMANRFFLLMHPEVAHEVQARNEVTGGPESVAHANAGYDWVVPYDGNHDNTLPPGFSGCHLVVKDYVVEFTPGNPAFDYTDLVPSPSIDMPGLVWKGMGRRPLAPFHRWFRPGILEEFVESWPVDRDMRPVDPGPFTKDCAEAAAAGIFFTPEALAAVSDPSVPPYPEPEPPRLIRDRRKRYDWTRAAQLLGEGHSVSAVALEIGCARQSLWRAIKVSPQLRAMVEEERMKRASEFAARLDGARMVVLESMLQAACLDRSPHVLVALARMMRLDDGANYVKLAEGLDQIRDQLRRRDALKETKVTRSQPGNLSHLKPENPMIPTP